MKKSIAMVMMITVFAAFGSPASLVVKTTEKIAAKTAVKTEAKKVGAVAAAHAGGRMAAGASPALLAAQAERARNRALAKSAGEMARNVATPKNILAAGGATAAVVAAHEVSDGVQSTCESIGKAVEHNPDLVPQVADSLSSSLKWSVIPLGVVLAGFLAWILWPFAKSVRAASDFISTKFTKRLAKKVEENASLGQAVRDVAVDQTVATKSGKVNAYLLAMIAGFVLLTVIGIWRIADRESGGRFGAAGDSPRISNSNSRLADEIKRIRADYVAELDRAENEFIASVESVANEHFGQVENMVPAVAARFGSLARCAGLVKALAVDKVKGTNTTEALVNGELEKGFYLELYAARDAVWECVARYATRMERARIVCNVEMKERGVDTALVDNARYDAILAEVSHGIDGVRTELRKGQNAAAWAAAVELICARETVSMVAKVLGKMAAREATATVAAGGAAAADGPFPFGDIAGAAIFLGGTAWTAWDVYQATTVLPERLCESMRDAVGACEKQCVVDVKDAGARLRAAYLEAARCDRPPLTNAASKRYNMRSIEIG